MLTFYSCVPRSSGTNLNPSRAPSTHCNHHCPPLNPRSITTVKSTPQWSPHTHITCSPPLQKLPRVRSANVSSLLFTKEAPRNLDPIRFPISASLVRCMHTFQSLTSSSHSLLPPIPRKPNNPNLRSPIASNRTFALKFPVQVCVGYRIVMDRLETPARLMIVSDLDHTMVDHHDTENLSLLRFNSLWEANYRHDSLLVFSTGRSPTLYKELRKEKPMLTPDITIMSVGTEITYGNTMVPDDGWVEVLNKKWDRNIVKEEASKFSELKLQAETEQRPHKVSFYVEKAKAQEVTKALSEVFVKRRLDVKIIYSGGMDLDILPQGAGKGQALAYLLKKFKSEGRPPVNTLVCGDSGNDAELFSIPEVYGVMVSNAQEELLHWHAENAKGNTRIIHATERCAAGIIQAIGHFKLGPSLPPRDIADFSDYKLENPNPGHELVKFFLFYEKWRRAEVENSEIYLASLKADCSPSGTFVHPSGVEHSLSDSINALRNCYGDKQGKQFRVWVDGVLATHVGSNTWLVKFDKWELSGEERYATKGTAVISSKGSGVSVGFTWIRVHQTWYKGYEAKDDSTWFF